MTNPLVKINIMTRQEQIEHLRKQIEHHKWYNHYAVVRELQQLLDHLLLSSRSL